MAPISSKPEKRSLVPNRGRLIEKSLKWIAENGGQLPSEQIKCGPMIADIQRATCEHFGISNVDLISRRRTLEVVIPRQIAVYLSKKHTLQSLPQISQKFGGRDHTTALYSIRKIEYLEQRDEKISSAIAAIESALGIGGNQ